MKWKDKLIKEIYNQLSIDNAFAEAFDNAFIKQRSNIHLAIFNEPFLSYLFLGKKTIESRLSNNYISPFGKVNIGDLILVKRSGGSVEGVFIAAEVKSLKGNINIKKCLSIDEYKEKLCIEGDSQFLENKNTAQYATLITVSNLKRINPINIEKNDRTGWVLLKKGFHQTLFNELYG